MTNLEKEELVSRIQAMDQEEIKLTLRCIASEALFDELMRRDAEYAKAVKAVREAVKMFC